MIRALVLLGLLAACHDRETEALTRVKQRVCACTTVACAEDALKAIPQGAVPPGDVTSSHRAQGVARDMLDCLAKLYAAQRPSTDPDAGSGSN